MASSDTAAAEADGRSETMGVPEQRLSPTATKHLHALDGLRGMIAYAVVAFHYNSALMPNGSRRVDIFFMLSGFVIPFSYERRLAGGMRTGEFLSRRVARLFPMLAFAALFATAASLLNTAGWSAPGRGGDHLALYTLLALLLIPALLQRDGQAEIYPVNPPIWSMFFETVANLGYVLLHRWLSTAVLVAAVVVSAAVVMWKGFGGNHVHNIHLGFFRVALSFSLGMLIFRLWRADALPWLRIGFIPATLLLLVLLVQPLQLGPVFSVLALLPSGAIILGAARARTGPVLTWMCTMLGAISYPMYLLHAPLLEVLKSAAGPALTQAPVVLGFFGGLTLLSYLVLRFYETPARRWLGRRLRDLTGGKGGDKRRARP